MTDTFPQPVGGATPGSAPPRSPRAVSAKFIVAGGFGAGKTTFVDAVSEIPPLRTEEEMTNAAAAVDDLSKVSRKASTTVAMDFGRITVSPDLVLYLFGTPGQARFSFMWDKICLGALGCVLLVDTRRIADSFGPIDYFEERGIPFIIGVNVFPGSPMGTEEQLREALSVDDSVPIVHLDARNRETVKETLIRLIDHLMVRRTVAAPTSAPAIEEATPKVVPDGHPIGKPIRRHTLYNR